jgi:hypothetical protein
MIQELHNNKKDKQRVVPISKQKSKITFEEIKEESERHPKIEEKQNKFIERLSRLGVNKLKENLDRHLSVVKKYFNNLSFKEWLRLN